MLRSRTLNVLLVEDNPVHAKIIQRAFGGGPTEVSIQHVTDGDLAVEYVQGSGIYADRDLHPLPDMILLDLRMHRMDGLAVLQILKGDDATRPIPIVVLS